jgi:hypothetical protein
MSSVSPELRGRRVAEKGRQSGTYAGSSKSSSWLHARHRVSILSTDRKEEKGQRTRHDKWTRDSYNPSSAVDGELGDEVAQGKDVGDEGEVVDAAIGVSQASKSTNAGGRKEGSKKERTYGFDVTLYAA